MAGEGEVLIPIESPADIIAARQKGRELAEQVGFSNSDLAVIATAISEVARNILEHASTGEVTIAPLKNGHRQGLKIVATDKGPGIADVRTVMQDGYSTGNGLGIGLPGTKRLMDRFEISSQPGKGTTVIMKKWVP